MFSSRSGRGGAVREDIRGVVATAFDHWDSRAGDPHLHTHVVVANRAQSVSDGRWRSLDSRTLFGYVVALSELHEGVLQDLLSERLGYAWKERVRVHSAVPRHDIEGVPDALIGEFSRRSAHIEEAMTGLVSDFASAHGRQPSRVETLRLRQQATLSTRPEKQHHTLSEQTHQWRARARPHLAGDGDTAGWVASLRDRNDLPALDAVTIDVAMLKDVAAVALGAVATKRATFSAANVLAEVHRQLHGVRFATPADRLAVADHTAALALEPALLLTPPGSSRSGIYTTREILDAETRLLEASRDATGPCLTVNVVGDVLATAPGAGGHPLTSEQAGVVHSIAGSGRVLDLLVGPAGTGKTRTLATVRGAWEAKYGRGSVIGLAPSAAAAQVLGDELGIATDNTTKWLTERNRNTGRQERIAELEALIGRTTSSPSTARARELNRRLQAVQEEHDRWDMGPGQLVIIDEASLAGTLALDVIVTQARDAGAKVLLVGDWAQLGAIAAGGAFAMLAHDRGDVPELGQVHRFTQEWERDASTRLRVGDPGVIDTYMARDRIRSGDRDTMLEALYASWRDDTKQGLASVMIAADRESVADLNQRAQAERIAAGDVSDVQTKIANGTAGVGDQVVTRRNNRMLRIPGGWVKNGDTWTVVATRSDGSLRVRADDSAEVILPDEYVRDHVELGYATTAHRVQGRTVDTAHALISATNTREVLYVGATRGCKENTLYVDTAGCLDEDTSHGPMTDSPAADVLRQVIDKTGADTSAHAAVDRERVLLMAFDHDRRATSPPPPTPPPTRWTQHSDTRTVQIGA